MSIIEEEGGGGGGLDPKGNWNASTNSPTLASGVGSQGEYYVVSVAGTTTLDGISVWNVNDWVIFNGTVWEKNNNTFYLARDTTGTPFLTPANPGDDFKMSGDFTFGIGSDTAIDAHIADGTVKAKMNANGDSFFNGGYTEFGGDAPNTTLSIFGSLSTKTTNAGAANYNPSVLTTDYKIVVNNTAAPRAVIISTEDIQVGTPEKERNFLISDRYGQAATNAITVSGESGTINGVASKTITTNYDSMSVDSDGTNLTIV